MNFWGLPTSVEIGGRSYEVNADFRDVLEIIEYLTGDEDAYVRLFVALSLFYEAFETMPTEDYQEAADYMMQFINVGEAVPQDGRSQPKLIDWEQDRTMIAAEVNRVAGQEVRALDFLHWWTFMGYFSGIGDGQLAMIVGIREKLRKGKPLEKHEREFYRENREKVDFKRKYTAEDDEIFNKW